MNLLIEKYYNEVQDIIERAKVDNIIIGAYYTQIGGKIKEEIKIIDTGILIGKDIVNGGEYKTISTYVEKFE